MAQIDDRKYYLMGYLLNGTLSQEEWEGIDDMSDEEVYQMIKGKIKKGGLKSHAL